MNQLIHRLLLAQTVDPWFYVSDHFCIIPRSTRSATPHAAPSRVHAPANQAARRADAEQDLLHPHAGPGFDRQRTHGSHLIRRGAEAEEVEESNTRHAVRPPLGA